ncbi:hypothetical protein BU16DRAFT_530112 [Lophium mytilinum]|uniref:Uncharacterized protein n=1 Tax=Lophium mytilinum TaxID=390894 RepID=A0A6A6QHG3_9PEZI|nr:hypothetical protein BU16DRAFT_530112 [Lophium mytilinum]
MKPKGRLGHRPRLSAVPEASNEDGQLATAPKAAPTRITREYAASDDDKENEPLPPPSDQVEQVGEVSNVRESRASIYALEVEQAEIDDDDGAEKESQGNSDSTVSISGSHSGVELEDSVVVAKKRRLGAEYCKG